MGFERLTLSGYGNLDLIEELYDRYQQDPSSVDPTWRAAFTSMISDEVPAAIVIDQSAPADLRIDRLIRSYRTWGHLKADINPIRTTPIKPPWQLDLGVIGFKESELKTTFPTNGLLHKPEAPLQEMIDVLEAIYCSKIGVEYMGIQNLEMQHWIQKKIEPNKFQIALTIDQKRSILQHLNKSELFEVFLHTKYVGQKRFSLEGGETLIPILAALIDTGSGLDIEEFVIGMAHRGRLNVLSNILKKSYSLIFSEFEEGYIPLSFEGSGDVKYHKGFSSKIDLNGKKIDIRLTPNPSHLEAVNPVVLGQVRAYQDSIGDEKREHSLPILIHGDAAIAGQGIIYETLQLYGLEGYATGGSIHLVINNQIGFTTTPENGRSTGYCTDIARAFDAPVFHVNAEDPEGCVAAIHLAIELRQKFQCDVFIDLNCYRKYGHNEGDEPAFTQPHEYDLIRSKKSIREIYRDDLISQGVLERKMAEALEVEFKEALQEALTGLRLPEKKFNQDEPPKRHQKKKGPFAPVQTGVDLKTLKFVAEKICTIPKNVTVHRKLKKLIKERMEMVEGKKGVDWGMGETLAYATLLNENRTIRLSGQDSCRGTFSHRHAVWMDQKEEKEYCPFDRLNGNFYVYNSPLSEYAVLGFEFGYSFARPDALVLWEAQFGDFCNGAQIIIDQFISTSEMKWGQVNSVTLLLPHGYEGQGPEHSSARMERFLSLCGDWNMQIVNPTLPVQMFHLLRRQLHKPMEKPLVIFTPKGLLRHPECVNDIGDFTKGHFQEVLDDPLKPKNIETLVLCSGRMFYDLNAERRKRKNEKMAILRIEQLYPLYKEKLTELIESYKGFKTCYWVQEEPENMGAWDFIRPQLLSLLPKGVQLEYIGRSQSASPAVGSFALHQKQHKKIIEALFGKEEA
ncbi:2-oxoglutarate dehydrogenase E1 component [Waddlia chondrophila 2032/99]|uniref:oxoglutarate dehydrogenase (succinyl-transferring) n=2 Tax=Waddlia chondrophila TaxID=71667 RepID=D6YW46_WADCW|nr:2-oxoglutarate dehydrogenase E1 component [Waddlia chondrophila]ADI38357.1 2-oxoglutarate dehydrogenase E1 component [Waddlia chondrophila WSU 86-1044]CCB91440.1 2-oxoglutarate dehydrogenase E1 component [Waddlia chondrophila 2032/99]